MTVASFNLNDVGISKLNAIQGSQSYIRNLAKYVKNYDVIVFQEVLASAKDIFASSLKTELIAQTTAIAWKCGALDTVVYGFPNSTSQETYAYCFRTKIKGASLEFVNDSIVKTDSPGYKSVPDTMLDVAGSGPIQGLTAGQVLYPTPLVPQQVNGLWSRPPYYLTLRLTPDEQSDECIARDIEIATQHLRPEYKELATAPKTKHIPLYLLNYQQSHGLASIQNNAVPLELGGIDYNDMLDGVDIYLGDMNADCRYFNPKVYSNRFSADFQAWDWAIGSKSQHNGPKTNASLASNASKCAYDRIFVNDKFLSQPSTPEFPAVKLWQGPQTDSINTDLNPDGGAILKNGYLFYAGYRISDHFLVNTRFSCTAGSDKKRKAPVGFLILGLLSALAVLLLNAGDNFVEIFFETHVPPNNQCGYLPPQIEQLKTSSSTSNFSLQLTGNLSSSNNQRYADFWLVEHNPQIFWGGANVVQLTDDQNNTDPNKVIGARLSLPINRVSGSADTEDYCKIQQPPRMGFNIQMQGQEGKLFDYLIDMNGDGLFSVGEGDFTPFPHTAELFVDEPTSQPVQTVHSRGKYTDSFAPDGGSGIYLRTQVPLSSTIQVGSPVDIYVMEKRDTPWSNLKSACNGTAKEVCQTFLPDGQTGQLGSVPVNAALSHIVDYQPATPSLANYKTTALVQNNGFVFAPIISNVGNLANATVQKNGANMLFSKAYGSLFNVVVDVNRDGKFNSGDLIDSYNVDELTNFFNATPNIALNQTVLDTNVVKEWQSYLSYRLGDRSLVSDGVFGAETAAATYFYTCENGMGGELSRDFFQKYIAPTVGADHMQLADVGFRILDSFDRLRTVATANEVPKRLDNLGGSDVRLTHVNGFCASISDNVRLNDVTLSTSTDIVLNAGKKVVHSGSLNIDTSSSFCSVSNTIEIQPNWQLSVTSSLTPSTDTLANWFIDNPTKTAVCPH